MRRRRVQALVIGSGAAGLAAALRLKALGVREVVVVTEGLQHGTSINTGSDKQTYYKLGLYGDEPDSPHQLARTLFDGGSMHGDLALVEAACSDRCFQHLVNLNVPFPRDAYGQFIGYQTDHDTRRRATSCGPYTSRAMCRALIDANRAAGTEVLEGWGVSDLIVLKGRRCAGAVARHARTGRWLALLADDTVFAVGGPGGLYRDSVYPAVHNGSIGIALEAGARAQGLPESQYGMASIRFRWNVSGSYLQAVPRLVSTDTAGNDPREFLNDALPDPDEVASLTFLKGYQWPFDVRRAAGGSSRIDLLVHRERCERGRRVFLDFQRNPARFAFSRLSAEARDYLVRSGARQRTPIERLCAMNPDAVALYAAHGIDLHRDLLEIAVCAQHNNGGLAGDIWYESDTIAHLYPVGEVNGSHGVARPGGAALNAGQVGAFRAAERIAARQAATGALRLDEAEALHVAAARVAAARRLLGGTRDWRADRADLRERMTACGGMLRDAARIVAAAAAARNLYTAICRDGYPSAAGNHGLMNRQLAFAHWAYLSAIAFQIESGTGSRGSALVLGPDGPVPEAAGFRGQVLETRFDGRRLRHRWVPRRPIPPATDGWFETIWARFRAGAIYPKP
ncbi:MAG: FAD-binding protein [Lentisphaerae bacterium]|nr:FAD-binding protein [Lentisphaerota bacterium]